jgi:hypothetical protein
MSDSDSKFIRYFSINDHRKFLVLEMVKVSAKTDDNSGDLVIDAEANENQVEEKTNATSVLQKLRIEEGSLIEEKQNWLTLRESLQAKIRDEIEVRKINAEKLKTEIADLKLNCQEMTTALNDGLLEKQTE